MSYFDFFRQIFSGKGSDNTGEGASIRKGGKIVSKTITLSANNTTVAVNVFEFTGNVRVLGIYGRVKTATTLTNLTNAYFNTWDGTVERPMTAITGCTMSGFGVGAFFAKVLKASSALIAQNNNVGLFVEEGNTKTAFQELFLIQKIATTSYVRFTYTTTDAPIDAELEIFIEYVDNDYSSVTPA